MSEESRNKDLVLLNFGHWNSGRWGARAAPLVFLEYLSCPSEWSIALRPIPRAISA